MIYLLLSIIATVVLFIIFKLFDRYRINTLQAIVVNYIVAFCIGLFSYKEKVDFAQIISSSWFFGALFLGFLFISVFNVMALTAQRYGLSVTSVASKMSVIVPVIFGIYAYNESIGFLKVLGIFLALAAVYLVSVKEYTSIITQKRLVLPFILFIGSGIIDTTIKYVETTYVPKNGIPIFTASIFATAAILGFGVIGYKVFNKSISFSLKNVIAGLFLGVVNYYSVYFLLKALQYKGMESSTLFTINNVAVVALSTLLGLLLFRESMSKKNWMGIVLALLSIALVTINYNE